MAFWAQEKQRFLEILFLNQLKRILPCFPLSSELEVDAEILSDDDFLSTIVFL